MSKDFKKICEKAIKEDCKIFVETKDGETKCGMSGNDLTILLNMVGLLQQVLKASGCPKEYFDDLYDRTKTIAYRKEEW